MSISHCLDEDTAANRRSRIQSLRIRDTPSQDSSTISQSDLSELRQYGLFAYI